ncbi:MAG: dTDP-glucose 4,6-dehydratase [archaeon]
MRILVTGGCGFMGSDFIRYMARNHNILNYDKLTYAGNQDNLKTVKDNYQFVQGDILDYDLLIKTVEEFKPELIVHFAAETHVDRSIHGPQEFIKTNVLGTQVLLEIVKKYDLRLHHISTDEVFGELQINDPAFDEHSPYNPRSPYSASKAASDHLVRSYIHTYGIKATISNSSNNYGPYQYPEKVIPLFITNLIEGKKLPLYGTGKNIRNWIYVRDHSIAVETIISKGKLGETYCIGGPDELSNIELSKKILREMDAEEDMIKFVEDRKGHDFRYSLSSKKLEKLGWKSSVKFEDGLKKTVSWYKKNSWWWRKLKK